MTFGVPIDLELITISVTGTDYHSVLFKLTEDAYARILVHSCWH